MAKSADGVLDLYSDAPLTMNMATNMMLKLWEETFFPMLLKTFATKEELHQEFETFEHKFDQKLERRVRPIEQALNALRKEITIVHDEIGEMRDDISDMKEKAFTFQKDAQIKFDSHLYAIRKLNAHVFPASISDKGKKKYEI